MKPVRLGIIGGGRVVRETHMPQLAKLEGVAIALSCNSTPEKAARFAEDFAIPRYTTNWREVVHSSDVDAVLIGTQPYLHAPITIEALHSGKHVFCQARMAMSVAETEDMVKAWERSGLVAALCPPPDGMKGDRVIRRILSSGELGDVRSLQVNSYSDFYLDPAKPRHWRQSRKISGVNLLDVGILYEVVRRWIGDAEEVMAIGQRYTACRPAAAGAGTEPVERPDAVSIACRFHNGALGQFIHHYAVGVSSGIIDILGTKAALRYRLDDDSILLRRPQRDEWEEVEYLAGEAQEWTVEHDFIEALRGGPSPRPNFFDGLAYMRFSEAVSISIEKKKAVRVDRGIDSAP